MTEPHGVYVHCPMPGDQIELRFWNGHDVVPELLPSKRALELIAELTEAVLRSGYHNG